MYKTEQLVPEEKGYGMLIWKPCGLQEEGAVAFRVVDCYDRDIGSIWDSIIKANEVRNNLNTPKQPKHTKA